MSGLETLKQRINYAGGKTQISRMNEDKLRSLKKALLYSYQSATAILADGREFRCLINPDMIKNEYDNKYISIPFEDICLNEKQISEQENNKIKKTSEGIQTIGMKCGDVFTWKENNSDWLVYLQRLEETAYFRAEIRRCKYTVDVNGKQYKVFAARPSTNEIDWRNINDKSWNDIDYTLKMYITKDEDTEAFFHRFTVVNIAGKPWEVQAIDNMSSDGIITMYLKEWYQNSIKNEIEKEKEENREPEEEVQEEMCPEGGHHNFELKQASDNQGGFIPFYLCTKCDKALWEDEYQEYLKTKIAYIKGDKIIYPYDTKEYSIENAEGGKWDIDSQKVKIISQNETTVKITVTTGRSGSFNLKYIRENEEDIVLPITIDSL